MFSYPFHFIRMFKKYEVAAKYIYSIFGTEQQMIIFVQKLYLIPWKKGPGEGNTILHCRSCRHISSLIQQNLGSYIICGLLL